MWPLQAPSCHILHWGQPQAADEAARQGGDSVCDHGSAEHMGMIFKGKKKKQEVCGKGEKRENESRLRRLTGNIEQMYP